MAETARCQQSHERRLPHLRRLRGRCHGRLLLPCGGSARACRCSRRTASQSALQAAEIAGVAALLVHSLSEEAKRFYRSRGFVESPVKPLTMCLILESARKALKEGPPAWGAARPAK